MSIRPPPPMAPPREPFRGSAAELERHTPNSRRDELSTSAGVAAVFLGAILGLSVLFYVKTTRSHHREAAATMRPARPVDVASAAITVDADVATTDEGASLSMPPPQSTEIRLEVPKGAQLSVDGVDLPAETRSIVRPDAGLVHVLVKTIGSQDATVVLSADSPPTIKVVPEKKRPSTNPSAGVEMPSNPYD